MTTRAPIVLVAAVGLFALAGCNQYDQLIAKDQVADARWADYQAQLQRRADLVPNLVATVKASAQHEEKTLSEVTEARARATGITLSAEDLQDPEKVAAFQKAQDQLRGALSRLLVANEAYPDLKANAQFHDLQVQLEGTENRILRAREQYNEAVRDYNTELGKIRGAVVRRATGGTFKPRVYFQASSDAQQAPKVTF
jgi:LemA protein